MTALEWKPNLTIKVEPRDDERRPYPHQTAAWDALDRYYDPAQIYGEPAKRAGMMVVPTGGGKTYLAARWLLREHVAHGGRVLWLTHRRTLLKQAFHTFADAAHQAAPKGFLKLIAISAEDARWSQVTDHHVVFSTIQTAAMESRADFVDDLAARAPRGLFVVVDEAHHAASRGYQRVLKMLAQHDGHRLLGLSATPIRSDEDDEKRLWNAFQAIIYQVGKKTLIESGILARPAPETVATQVEFEREFTEEDYEHLARFGDLGPRVLDRLARHAARNQLIVEHYVKHRERYGKTIVFAANIEHSRTLAHEFAARGVPADYVDYGRADSQTVMDAYRASSSPEVLANVEMLTEGFDAPKTRTVFIARPTQSEALLAQMVGRALRGVKAGGNEVAYLVTFVDTWKQFHVLEAEYVVNAGPAGEAPDEPRVPHEIVPVAMQLIMEAYKLVKSNVRGDFVGLHQCLPHSWRRWEHEFETGEVQTRSVLVFDNQVDGFEQLEAEYATPERIPAEISESLARDLVRRYFGECQDPLPRWHDIKELLEAYRDRLEVKRYTFEEKAAFDPARWARRFWEQNLGPRDVAAELRRLFDDNAVCRMVYRDDFRTFSDEVNEHLGSFSDDAGKSKPPPNVVDRVPQQLGAWPDGARGYSLAQILDAVLSQKRHFPRDLPKIGDLAWSRRRLRTNWGFFRYSDQAMVLNRTLDSPDVPLFVVEFLVYHEALHADMPNAGHNKDFRERERRFVPSEAARVDALGRGLKPTTGEGAWRVLADQFLDTFQERFFVGRKVSM